MEGPSSEFVVMGRAHRNVVSLDAYPRVGKKGKVSYPLAGYEFVLPEKRQRKLQARLFLGQRRFLGAPKAPLPQKMASCPQQRGPAPQKGGAMPPKNSSAPQKTRFRRLKSPPKARNKQARCNRVIWSFAGEKQLETAKDRSFSMIFRHT